MVHSLSLVVIRCSDLEASKRFYEAVGLVFVSEQHDRGPQHWSYLVGSVITSKPFGPAYGRLVDHAPGLHV